MNILPALLSVPVQFVIYGLLCGYLFKLWRVAEHKYPLLLLLLYSYGIWFAGLALWLVFQLNSWPIRGVFILTCWLGYLLPVPPPGLRRWFKQNPKKRPAHQQQSGRYRNNWSHQQKQAEFQRWREQFIRDEAAKTNQQQQSTSSAKRQNRQYQTQDEQILGLTTGWSQEDLKKAYQRQAHRTHPDKWIGKPATLRTAMEAEYKLIQRAYKNLRGKCRIR